MISTNALLLAAALLGVVVNGYAHHHHGRSLEEGDGDHVEVAERPGFYGNVRPWTTIPHPLPIWAAESFPTQRDFIDSGARCAYKERSDEEDKMFENSFKLWKEAIAKDENKNWFNGRRLKTVTVPTYFHVLQDGKKGGVSDAQIDLQMQVLNDAFSSAGFEFQLKYQNGNKASRTNDKKWHQGKEETKYKARLRKGNKNALNVYFNEAKGYLGYAYYPSESMAGSVLDGVVVLYGAIPNGYAAPYNLGDTLVHEVSCWIAPFTDGGF